MTTATSGIKSVKELKKRTMQFRNGLAIDLVSALKTRCPVDTARLRNSIKYRIEGNTIEVYMIGYAVYVEFGTAPHIIKPKNAKALHWHSKKGRTQHNHPHSKKMNKSSVFAKVVNHPGTKPNPFIRTTLRSDFSKIIKDNIRRHLL